MIEYRGILRISRALASGFIDGVGLGRPREMDLRGAVSKNYYAMFHVLALTCANMLVGSAAVRTNPQAWRQTYRALNHGYARRQCNRTRLMSEFPIEIRNFGKLFVEMQIMRHRAEYDPFPQDAFLRASVLKQTDDVEDAIAQFLALPAADRRAFAVYVLLPVRGD